MDPTRSLVLRLWLPFSCGMLLSYAVRNANTVLVPHLTAEFGLSAAELGLLTSAFMLAFGIAQLPSGVLLDRYGPRRVNALLFGAAALGCVLFAVGRDFAVLAVGRGLMGLGVAVAMMSAAKAFSQWFPVARLPIATALLLAVGNVGTLIAAAPVGWAADHLSWRAVFVAFAIAFVVTAAFVWTAAPDAIERGRGQSLLGLARGLGSIFAQPAFWRLSLLSASIGGMFNAMTTLWVGPWLRDVAGLDRGTVIATLTAFAACSIVGFAVTGSVYDALIRRGVRPIRLLKIQAAISIAVFVSIAAVGSPAALPLWALVYIFGGSGPLLFPILARAFPAEILGRVNTACNLFIFISSFAAQWAIGVVLDRWPVVDGHYAAQGYAAALLAMVGLQVAALAGAATLNLPGDERGAARTRLESRSG